MLIKKGLLGLILFFLWFIIIQDLFNAKKVNPLYGYLTIPADPVFSTEKWKNGSFQIARENHLQQDFSLRPDYVRFYNTLKYRLFKKTNNEKYFTIGKNRHLHTTMQVKSYLGNDPISKKDMSQKIFFLKNLQDTLHKIGKEIYVVIPPIKPEIFPEHLPPNFSKKTKINNYEKYVYLFKKNNIRYVDLVDYFKKLKIQDDKDFFPHTGSHWNEYGAVKGMQYFIQYFNKTSKYTIGNIEITDIRKEKEKGAEPDIYHTLNLYNKYPSDMTYYVDTKIITSDSAKPKAVFISDSFFNQWNELGIRELFDSTTYDYYHHIIITKEKYEIEKKLSPVELVKGYDVYVILCNESNMARMGWGFIEEMYYYFYPNTPHRAYYDEFFRYRVYELMDYIKKNEEWNDLIIKKSKQKNIDTTQQLYEDAVWTLLNEDKK